MKYKIIGFSLGILAATMVCSYLPDKEQVIGDTKERGKQFELFWASYIEQKSPSVAYEDFKRIYGKIDPSEQHHAAHLFGGALYDATGLEGLSVCDMHFSSGCFHEFLGRALRDHGDSILKDVDRYCKNSGYDCQHGIGHGILAYSGYDYENLLQALALCRAIETTDVRDGCFGGIFMEYNVRSMLVNVPLRTQDEADAVDALCMSVPVYAVDSCYFWIAQWFLAQVEVPQVDQKFFGATRLCQGIEDTSSRLNCYSGIATDFPSYTHDIDVYKRHCDNTELEQGDAYHKIQCRAATASILFMDLNTRESAIEMCSSLEDKAYAFCRFHAVDGDGKRIPPYTQWLEGLDS